MGTNLVAGDECRHLTLLESTGMLIVNVLYTSWLLEPCQLEQAL